MTDNTASAADQLASEIDRLRAAIRTLDGMPDIQRPLLAQLADKEGQIAALQLQTGGVSFGQGTVIGQMGDAVAGDKISGDQVLRDKHVYYGAADVPDHDTLLREYLGALGGACNQLSLADADSSDPHRAAVELAAVFTRLEVAGTVLLTDDKLRARREQPGAVLEKERQRTALEVVASTPRLVLLGAPGGGKSTLVNFLGLCLAHAWLGEDGWLERLGAEWSAGVLLPVRVVLREFAAWVAARPQRPRAAMSRCCGSGWPSSTVQRWLRHSAR